MPPSPPQEFAMKVSDCSQMSDAAHEVGWDVDYQQLGSGAFDMNFTAIAGERTMVACERYNCEIVMCGTPPPGTISMLINWGIPNCGVYQGKPVGLNDVVFMRSGEEGILRVPAGLNSFTVSVSEKFLADALSTYNRSQLSAVLTEGSAIRFPPSVLSRIRSIIADAHRQLPIARDTWSHRCFEEELLCLTAQGLGNEAQRLENPLRLKNRNRSVRVARDYIESHLAGEL